MDERIIDYGSFIVAALIAAIVQLQPQLVAAYGSNPQDVILITLAVLVLSQIGSRISTKQAKIEAAEEAKLEAQLTKQ